MGLISFIWQLPQFVLGRIVLWFLKKHYITTYLQSRRNITRADIYMNDAGINVSFGDIIFVSHVFSDRMICHELGHTAQSAMLGPLYLPCIGLLSLLGYLLQGRFHYDYYRQPWEAWADRLGGVKR